MGGRGRSRIPTLLALAGFLLLARLSLAETPFPGYEALRARAKKLWTGENPEKGATLVLVPPGSPLLPAAKKLAEHRKAEILDFAPAAPEDSLKTLIEKKARFVTVFVEPKDMDVNLLRRFIVLSTLLDEDPFCDFAFGFVTASTPEKTEAFVDRILEADGKGVDPRTASFCMSNVSRKYPGSSFIEEMKGDSIFVKLGDMAFARKSLRDLEGPGFIHIGGHGDPEGVWMFSDKRNRDPSRHRPYDPKRVGEDPDGEMPRLLAGHFRNLKLKNPVVWTHVCHIGSVSRVFVEEDIVSTFGRCEKVEAYRIPEGRSVALAVIEAGVSAYIAPLGPNFGAQSDIEQAVASELGLPLGDVLRRAYHDVIMDTEGHPEKIGVYVEGKPAGWNPDGFTNHNSPHHRALYGDPLFRPFGKHRSPASVEIDADELDDRIILTFKLASSGYLGRTWYGNRGRENKGRGRFYEVVPLEKEPPALAVGDVVTKDASGKPFEILGKTALLERIDGKVFLHLQLVTDSAEALRKAGATVEAVVHFADKVSEEDKGPSEVEKALSTEWDLGKREWKFRDFLKTVREHLEKNRERFDWGVIVFAFDEGAEEALDASVTLDIRGAPLREGIDRACRKLGLKFTVEKKTHTVRFSRRPKGVAPPPLPEKTAPQPLWKPDLLPKTRERTRRLKELLHEFRKARKESLALARKKVQEIGEIRTAEASAAIKKIYKRDKEYLVKSGAIRGLRTADGGETAVGVLELLRTEKDRRLRKLLRITVLGLRARSAAEALVEKGLTHKDADIRAEVARALGALGWRGAVEGLIEAVKDSKQESRLAAIEALGTLGFPEAIEPLLEQTTGTDFRAVNTALWALGKLKSGDDRIGEAALKVLESGRSDPRIPAAVLLGKQGERKGVPILIPMLKSLSWSERSAAINALGEIRHRDAVAPLIERVGRERGRLLDEATRALYRTTGLDIGGEVKYWRAWWEKAGENFRLPPIVKGGLGARKPLTVATYHDLSIVSDRVIFLLDVSGSMKTEMKRGRRGAGTRLDFCRWELRKTLERLPRDVLFNIITFETVVRAWEKSVVRATPGAKENAGTFIALQKGVGGTNMAGALKIAFQDTRADTYFLLSDGFPDGDPEKLLRWLKEKNTSRHVIIHTLGVGEATTGDFLKKIAEITGGDYKALK